MEKPADLDVATVLSMGFPPTKGGLIFWADLVGADYICKKLDNLASQVSWAGNCGWHAAVQSVYSCVVGALGDGHCVSVALGRSSCVCSTVARSKSPTEGGSRPLLLNWTRCMLYPHDLDLLSSLLVVSRTYMCCARQLVRYALAVLSPGGCFRWHQSGTAVLRVDTLEV